MGNTAAVRCIHVALAVGLGAWPAVLPANAAISDLAREIGAVDRHEIARLIEDHRVATGHRIVVTTIPNASTIDLSDFAGGALGALGSAADTGIAVVHDRASNTARIVAGAALRSHLSDDDLYRVQTATMGPLLNAGDAGQAFRQGIARLIEMDVPPIATAEPADLPKLTERQDTLRIAIIGIPLILLIVALWSLYIRLRNRWSARQARRSARPAAQAVPEPAMPPPVAPSFTASWFGSYEAGAEPVAPVAVPPAPPRPAVAPLPGFGRG